MNLLVHLPLFLLEVFTQEAVVSGRQFTRLTQLDNVRPDGTPAVIYQSRSKLECISFCARDEACVAVMYHGGQCSIYRTPLSPSSVSLLGIRCFSKQVHHEYIGCYLEYNNMLEVPIRWRTTDCCVRTCYGRSYSYAGFGEECYCGDAVPHVDERRYLMLIATAARCVKKPGCYASLRSSSEQQLLQLVSVPGYIMWTFNNKHDELYMYHRPSGDRDTF